jgi:hypothetical protein
MSVEPAIHFIDTRNPLSSSEAQLIANFKAKSMAEPNFRDKQNLMMQMSLYYVSQTTNIYEKLNQPWFFSIITDPTNNDEVLGGVIGQFNKDNTLNINMAKNFDTTNHGGLGTAWLSAMLPAFEKQGITAIHMNNTNGEAVNRVCQNVVAQSEKYTFSQVAADGTTTPLTKLSQRGKMTLNLST